MAHTFNPNTEAEAGAGGRGQGQVGRRGRWIFVCLRISKSMKQVLEQPQTNKLNLNQNRNKKSQKDLTEDVLRGMSSPEA